MYPLIQQIVDIMVIAMACIVALFTLGLLLLHFITNANEKHLSRIRAQILRLINTNAYIEYIKGKIYSLIDPEGTVMSIREIGGIRTRRGVQVLEIVARESDEAQRNTLRKALQDAWFGGYMQRKLGSRDRDTAIIIMKLIAELRIPGYTELIEADTRRWSGYPEAQQLGLLAFFMRGQQEELVKLFSDKSFKIVLSFRILQELFHCYHGDHGALYGALLPCAADQYVRRACIRGIGIDGCVEMSEAVYPELFSDNVNLCADAVRTAGRLRYARAAERVRFLTSHERWELRSIAVEALVRIDPDNCYDTLLKCLCDREWWVRFHAAEALVGLQTREKLIDDVKKTGDCYAFEMLRFMIEREDILKGEKTA